MQNKLSSLFGTLSEPVIAASNGDIIYRNTSAKHSGVFAEAELSELVPEMVLSLEADNFITETVLGGEKYAISGTVLDDITVYVFRSDSGVHSANENDIIASVSIALREPLSIMNIAANQLLPFAEQHGNERISEYASWMHRGIFSIIRTLNRLDALSFLNGSVSVSPERATVDLVQLAGDLVDTLSQLLGIDEGRLCLTTKLTEASVLGDKRLIERMLLCLIGNALVFTPDEAQIKITIKTPDGKALISVSDNGGGISDSARYDIWSRYEAWRELDDTKRGAGFGLSVVQAIARMHGGNALIESQAGSGTTVIISLAAAPDEGIVPVFNTPVGYATVSDMREIFAELVNIIPKEKLTSMYMD